MYYINEKNILHYLSDIGLAKYEDALLNRIKITNVSSRNNNFIFSTTPFRSYFLKQNRIQEAEFQRSVRVESALYQHFRSTNESELTAIVPAFVFFDKTANILITKLENNVLNLQALFSDKSFFQWKEIVAKQGTLLGRFHWSQKPITENRLSILEKSRPWTFELTEAHSRYQPKNELGRQIISFLKEDETYKNAVREALSQYSFEHIIHGDVKNSNFITNEGKEKNNLKIIDWEIASWGDPAWDVAGIWQSLVWLAINSGNTAYSDRRRAFQVVKTCAKVFWAAYTSSLPSRIDQGDIFKKSIRFTGVRIIQSCLEATQTLKTIPVETVEFMQLGVNTVINPERTIHQIFSDSNG